MTKRSNEGQPTQFDDSAKASLKRENLSDSVIQELEERLFQESRIRHALSPGRPKSSQEREQINGLKRSVQELRGRISELDPFISSHLRQRYPVNELDKTLQRFEIALAQLPKIKATAGNRELNFGWVICLIAEILLKNGIRPKQRGKQFYNIVYACFEALKIEREAQSAITKVWPAVKDMMLSSDILGDEWRT